MVFQMLPAPVAAQQPAPDKTEATKPSDPTLNPAQAIAASQASPQKPQRDWPTFGPGFKWVHPGVAPMIPPEMIPGFGVGDEEVDRRHIEGVILELPGYEIPSRIFYSFVSLSTNDGKPVDPFFVEDLKTLVKTGKFYKFDLPESTLFRTRMGWGYKNKNGVHEVKLTGVPYIEFDKKYADKLIYTYVFETIIPKTGLYKDLPLSLLIPFCFNGVFQEGYDVPGDDQTELLVPTKPLTAKVRIVKDWRKNNGNRANTPERDKLQLRFEAVPVTGGDTVPTESFDNKKAEMELEVGKKYTIRELLDSAEWRATREEVTVQIGVKNDDIKFENIEVREGPETSAFATAMAGPPGRDGADGEDGRDGKGTSKKKLIIGGVIAGIVGGLICVKVCSSETIVKRDVIVEPGKNGNGGGQP